MKKAFILILVITSLSYDSETKKKEVRLLGEWGIYIFYINDMGALCNVCPRIVFKESHIAELILPSGDVERYSWRLSNTFLKLKFLENLGGNHYI